MLYGVGKLPSFIRPSPVAHDTYTAPGPANVIDTWTTAHTPVRHRSGYNLRTTMFNFQSQKCTDPSPVADCLPWSSSKGQNLEDALSVNSKAWHCRACCYKKDTFLGQMLTCSGVIPVTVLTILGWSRGKSRLANLKFLSNGTVTGGAPASFAAWLEKTAPNVKKEAKISWAVDFILAADLHKSQTPILRSEWRVVYARLQFAVTKMDHDRIANSKVELITN